MANEKRDNKGMLFGGGAGLLAVVIAISGQAEQMGILADILQSSGGRMLLGGLAVAAIGGFMFQQIVVPLREDKCALTAEVEKVRETLMKEREEIRRTYEQQIETMRQEFNSKIETLNKQILALTRDLATTNAKLEVKSS